MDDGQPSAGPVPRKPAPAALTDADAAAVMVMLLGEEQASGILSQLDPDELHLLGEKMVALGDIGPEAIVQAIALSKRPSNWAFIPMAGWIRCGR